MACDITLMEENEEVKVLARNLGFSKLIFKNDIKKFKILEIQDYQNKRKAVENNSLRVLLNPHLTTAKDSFHFRNSGLDQVICKAMQKNDIALGFSLDKINNYVEIGRIMQNIRLCRKYKVKMLFFTFASNLYGLRAKNDLMSFLQVLGMNPKEANESFSLS